MKFSLRNLIVNSVGNVYVPEPGYPFSPSDVSGLKLWLKADQISASDNDPIDTWADQSGNGYDVTAILTARPTYKTNIKNSLPVARFDGTLNAMSTSTNLSNIITAAAFSAWFVVNVKAYNNGSGSDLYGNEAIWTENVSGNIGLYAYSVTGVPYIGFENYGGGEDAVKSSAADTWYVVHMRHDSGNTYISLNGGSETSIASGNSSISSTLRLGANYAASFLEMDLAEALFYNVAVGSTDRDSIQSYLNTKWAVY